MWKALKSGIEGRRQKQWYGERLHFGRKTIQCERWMWNYKQQNILLPVSSVFCSIVSFYAETKEKFLVEQFFPALFCILCFFHTEIYLPFLFCHLLLLLFLLCPIPLLKNLLFYFCGHSLHWKSFNYLHIN